MFIVSADVEEMHEYRNLRDSDLDLLCCTPEELQKMKSRKFIQSILAEGKVINERK